MFRSAPDQKQEPADPTTRFIQIRKQFRHDKALLMLQKRLKLLGGQRQSVFPAKNPVYNWPFLDETLELKDTE